MCVPKIQVEATRKAYSIATIDSKAEVNIMSKSFAKKARLLIQTEKTIRFQGIARGEYYFVGVCEAVEIAIRGIVNYVNFLIINKGSINVLLGMLYLIKSKLSFKYKEDRSMFA